MGGVCYKRAYGAQAYDAELFAGKLRPHESFLTFFDKFRHVRAAALKALRPVYAVCDPAR